MTAFNTTIDRYRELLAGVGTGRLKLPNNNFDVGAATKAGQYTLADAAYAELLHKLENHYASTPEDLRGNILTFYKDASLTIEAKTPASDRARLRADLDQLGSISRDLSPAAAGVSNSATGPVAR